MSSTYPDRRLRRLRGNERIRRMVRQTHLTVEDLIYPLFVCSGKNVRREVGSMPGVFNYSVDALVEECRQVVDLGIPAVLLFGIPPHKDEEGSQAWADDGIVQQALRSLRDKFGDELILIADTCLCEYTSHGHCGLVSESGVIENDSTLERLQRTAVSQARAGAHIIAPSDMMDGRVGAIRQSLDTEQFTQIPILSYAVKYASASYGPFRDAAGGAPKFGDRKTHQMDPANVREAYEEARLDIAEGADMLMVKPAGAYLDVIAGLRERFDLPLAAYQVSGEYAAIKAGGQLGWIDAEAVMMENTMAIKRAGADLILTYFAKEIAAKLQTPPLP